MLATLCAAVIFQTTETSFDFWVGSWELSGKSRTTPGKEEFTDTKATNTIQKTLGGKVIEENFKMIGFTGRSVSVFNPRRKIWQQTWVDDSGAYLLFEGGMEPEGMTLHLKNGQPGVQMRMVFKDVKKDSIQWLWQRSADEGKSWETQWELNYRRKSK